MKQHKRVKALIGLNVRLYIITVSSSRGYMTIKYIEIQPLKCHNLKMKCFGATSSSAIVNNLFAKESKKKIYKI